MVFVVDAIKEVFIFLKSITLAQAVGVATVAIAYWQYQANQRIRRNDLFDKRYAFYQELEDFWLSTVCADSPELDVEDLAPAAVKAEFLFGEDISKHILSLADKRHKGSPFFPDDDFVRPFKKYLKLK